VEGRDRAVPEAAGPAEKIPDVIVGCQLSERGTDKYPRRGCTTDNKSFSPARVPEAISRILPGKFRGGGEGAMEIFLRA